MYNKLSQSVPQETRGTPSLSPFVDHLPNPKTCLMARQPPAFYSSFQIVEQRSIDLEATGVPSNIPDNNGAHPTRKRRRTHTPDRKATHNATERARRETLNGRFLVWNYSLSFIPFFLANAPSQELAALLPDLHHVPRPTKSSIVNSSIERIKALDQHHLVAAHELRLLKHESDMFRRELNQWRISSGLPRVDTPFRSEAFERTVNDQMKVFRAPTDEEEVEGDHASRESGDDPTSLSQSPGLAYSDVATAHMPSSPQQDLFVTNRDENLLPPNPPSQPPLLFHPSPVGPYHFAVYHDLRIPTLVQAGHSSISLDNQSMIYQAVDYSSPSHATSQIQLQCSDHLVQRVNDDVYHKIVGGEERIRDAAPLTLSWLRQY